MLQTQEIALKTSFYTFNAVNTQNKVEGEFFEPAVFCIAQNTYFPVYIWNLKQFLRVVLAKKSKNHHFQQFFAKISRTRFFFENRAQSVSSLYSPPTSCKKAKKSLEQFPRSGADQPTTHPTNGTDFIGPSAKARRSSKLRVEFLNNKLLVEFLNNELRVKVLNEELRVEFLNNELRVRIYELNNELRVDHL